MRNARDASNTRPIETTYRQKAVDTAKKATAKDYKARAFYSYLIPFRGSIAVEEGKAA